MKKSNLLHYRKIFVLFFAIMLILSTNQVFSQTPVAVHGQLSIDGNRLKDQHGDNYQLRGMSFFWSNWDGKFWNYDLVKWLRDDWNVNVVRAAMGTATDDNSGYIGNPEVEMHKMITVIEAAIDLGIYVVVDWHSHAAENELSYAQEFFTYIAQNYGNHPNILYETYNEPVNQSWRDIKDYHNSIIPTIRQYDQNNVIILGTPFYSQGIVEATNDPVAGDNLCYALHYYANSHIFWDDVETVQNKGFHVFVSEFGTCSSDGGGNVNEGNSNTWWDILDRNGVSWCNWSISDKDEAASIVKPGSSIYGGWSSNDLTASGTLVRNRLRSYQQDPIPTDIPPYITSSPRSVSVPSGSNTSFTVEVAGSNPSYEWFFNNQSILNSNSATLTINNATDDNVGEYYCVITNTHGSTTSRTVTLEVRYRSTFYDEPIALPGVVQFEDYDRGGQNIGYLDADFGNTPGHYREDDVDIARVGNTSQYYIGYTVSGEWLAYTVNVGWAGEYTIDISYASPAAGGGSYSIELNDQIIVPVTTLSPTGGWESFSTTRVTVDLEAGENILKFNIVTTGFNIDYMLFESTTPPETEPVIILQPNDVTVSEGRNATFSVSATGAQPLTYQWYFNNQAISGANERTLEIQSVSDENLGNYYVEITNHLGSVTSSIVTLELGYVAYGGVPALIPGRVFAKNFDEGGQGVAYYDTTEDNEGVTAGGNTNFYRAESVDTEATTDGSAGHSVGYIDTGEWLEYTVNVEHSGTYSLDFRIASAESAGALGLDVNGQTAINSISVPNTAGWTAWQTINTEIELSAGINVLRFNAVSGGFNFNYMEFSIDLNEELITINSGWNLFALSIVPSDNSINSIFAGQTDLLIKSEDGFYSSSQEPFLNSITTLEAGKGYLIYNGSGVYDISLVGSNSELNPDFDALPNGWNLVGISGENISVNTLPQFVEVVKDFDTFYMPDSPSQLTDLEKGKAYFVKINR